MCKHVRFASGIATRSGLVVTLRRMPRAMQAHSCREAPTRQVDVGESRHHERPRGVLRESPVASLVEAPRPLDHGEHMLDARAHTRLHPIEDAVEVLGGAAFAYSLVRAVLGPRCLRLNQLVL